MKSNHPDFIPPSPAIEQRITDILNRLTLEEKIDLLGGEPDGRYAGYSAWARGSKTKDAADGGRKLEDCGDTRGIARAGIPPLKFADASVGIHWWTDRSTTYPATIALAAAWDPDLAYRAGAALGRDALILSQCAHVCQRSVRWGDWLYMRTYHDGLHPHFEPEMLFNLQEDPHETRNLAEERPDLVREGAARLLAWRDEQMRTMPWGYTTDPLEQILKETGPFHANRCIGGVIAQRREYLQRLRDTGRGHWIEKMIERHPDLAAARGAKD